MISNAFLEAKTDAITLCDECIAAESMERGTIAAETFQQRMLCEH